MRRATILVLLLLALFLADLGSAWRRRRRRRRRRRQPVCVRRDCTWKRGACSSTCGYGFYQYSRATVNTCGGTCNKPRVRCFVKCPVNCQVHNWSVWSSCSNTCGQNGTQIRTRQIKVIPRYKGKACPATRETKACTGRKETCRWRYVGCSAVCGKGSRIYKLLSANLCGMCKMPQIPCVGTRCSVHCRVSAWGAWSSCRTGSTLRYRTRSIIAAPKHGGNRCPVLRQTRTCPRRCCTPRVCLWKWSTCTGRGKYGLQSPRIIRSASCGGTCILPKSRRCVTRCSRRLHDQRNIFGIQHVQNLRSALRMLPKHDKQDVLNGNVEENDVNYFDNHKDASEEDKVEGSDVEGDDAEEAGDGVEAEEGESAKNTEDATDGVEDVNHAEDYEDIVDGEVEESDGEENSLQKTSEGEHWDEAKVEGSDVEGEDVEQEGHEMEAEEGEATKEDATYGGEDENVVEDYEDIVDGEMEETDGEEDRAEEDSTTFDKDDLAAGDEEAETADQE